MSYVNTITFIDLPINHGVIDNWHDDFVPPQIIVCLENLTTMNMKDIQ